MYLIFQHTLDLVAHGFLGKSGKENGGPVPGIQFEVKRDFQVIEDGIVDVVGFVNDNDRVLPLFKGKAGDFFLNGSEIIGFAEGRLCARLLRRISAETVCRQCGLNEAPRWSRHTKPH